MYFESYLHVLLRHNDTFKWLLQSILNKLNPEHPTWDFLFLLPIPFLCVYQKLSIPQWRWHQLWRSLNPVLQLSSTHTWITATLGHSAFTEGFWNPIKTHGKTGVALEKTIFCPLDLMNVSLMMLARDTWAGNFNKCNRCTTIQIFSYSVDTTGKYFLCLNKVKLSHRSDLLIYKYVIIM